jgi:hypothetical protein
MQIQKRMEVQTSSVQYRSAKTKRRKRNDLRDRHRASDVRVDRHRSVVQCSTVIGITKIAGTALCCTVQYRTEHFKERCPTLLCVLL